MSFNSMLGIMRISGYGYVILTALSGLVPGLGMASDHRAVCPSPTADDYFFPTGIFDQKAKGLDELKRQWYSEHLNAMSEPSLSCGSLTDTNTYRFTWLRSFRHPIAVRVSMASSGPTVTAIELDGKGGYRPGVVKLRIEVPITSNQWKTLLASLENAGFWQEPTRDSFRGGLDGARWIFEGRSNGTYHVVDRWSPGTGPYYSLGRVFLDLAGIVPPANDLY